MSLMSLSISACTHLFISVEVILMAEVFKVLVSGYLSIQGSNEGSSGLRSVIALYLSLLRNVFDTCTIPSAPVFYYERVTYWPIWCYLHECGYRKLWSLLISGKEMMLLVILYTISNVSGFNAVPLIGAAWYVCFWQFACCVHRFIICDVSMRDFYFAFIIIVLLCCVSAPSQALCVGTAQDPHHGPLRRLLPPTQVLLGQVEGLGAPAAG